MWLHICMAGPMMTYRCDITSILAAQVAHRPTNFCLLLLSTIPYFIYFVPRLQIIHQTTPKYKVAAYGVNYLSNTYSICIGGAQQLLFYKVLPKCTAEALEPHLAPFCPPLGLRVRVEGVQPH